MWVQLLIVLVVAFGSPEDLRAVPDPPFNFVVFLTDDQRFDTLWAMPLVQDRLGSRGVTFNEAIATNALCCPFRASLLSGGFASPNSGVRHNLPPNGGMARFRDSVSLGTLLQGAGYATALVGRYLNGYAPPYIPPGWTVFEVVQGALDSSFSSVRGSSGAQEPSSGTVMGPFAQYGTDYLRDRALELIDAWRDQPFFLLLSFEAPHAPATPAPGDESLFASYEWRGRGFGEGDLSDKPLWVQRFAFYPEQAQEDEFHRNQLRSLQAVDRAVAAVVDQLESLGLLERTAIVFVSDNGLLWGEHGLIGKPHAYEEALRVPLIVVHPGASPRSDDHLVAADLDLPATILELAGIPFTSDGISLVPLLFDANLTIRPRVAFEGLWDDRSYAGVRVRGGQGNWKYVEHTTAERELYDLTSDPFELLNRAGDPSLQTLVTALSTWLAPRRGLAILTGGRLGPVPGVAYNHQLRARGGTPPYTWSIWAGQLPAGLTLDAVSGLVSGIATQPGEFQEVIVGVEDSSISPQHGGPQMHYTRTRWQVAP